MKNATNKASNIQMPNLFPYGPQHQLATGGPVPYNVVDGVHLRDQMMMSAKKFSDKLRPSNYPIPDPPMSMPQVKYKPKKIEEVKRMRQGKGPTTKMTHGDKNIEAHHRQQIPVKDGGILDELEQKVHRGKGNHTRHDKPSQLTPSERAKEIRNHYKDRGKEYILPGEGI